MSYLVSGCPVSLSRHNFFNTQYYIDDGANKKGEKRL